MDSDAVKGVGLVVAILCVIGGTVGWFQTGSFWVMAYVLAGGGLLCVLLLTLGSILGRLEDIQFLLMQQAERAKTAEKDTQEDTWECACGQANSVDSMACSRCGKPWLATSRTK